MLSGNRLFPLCVHGQCCRVHPRSTSDLIVRLFNRQQLVPQASDGDSGARYRSYRRLHGGKEPFTWENRQESPLYRHGPGDSKCTTWGYRDWGSTGVKRAKIPHFDGEGARVRQERFCNVAGGWSQRGDLRAWKPLFPGEVYKKIGSDLGCRGWGCRRIPG